jgi:hypothetical protein
MGILALISVLVVSASSDHALFLASIEVIRFRWLLLLAGASAVAALLQVQFPNRLTAALLLFGLPAIALFATIHTKLLLDTGQAIYLRDGSLYLTSHTDSNASDTRSGNSGRYLPWENQVPSLAHVTPALFDGQPVIDLPFARSELRAQLRYSPARSTTLACFYFITITSLLCWLAAVPVALFRTVWPTQSPALTFLTACPALWTGLMVTTLYLLK